MPSRRQIRAEMRRRRRGLSESERAALSIKLARRLVYSALLRRSTRVACYLPNDGEVDLTPLIHTLWSMKRTSYLPVLHNQQLWFLPFAADTPLASNRFGIPEPDVSSRRRCAPAALDLVLMPLVAFDDKGNRLGMGGGYYDQTFAYLRRRRRWRKPVLLGVAYELQRSDLLPACEWDVPLDGVATERGVTQFCQISCERSGPENQGQTT